MPYSVSTSAWRPHVRAAVKELNDKFTPSSVGTYPGHSPTMSLAADFMCNKEDGDAIAEYAKANAKRLGIQYIIWYRRIWNIERDKEGWRPYKGKNSSPSAQHTNHVHISWYSRPGTGGPPIVTSMPITPIGLGLDGLAGGINAYGDIMEVKNQVGEVYGILKKTADWVTDKQNWINLLLILIGCYLIIIALYRLAGGGLIRTVKAVAG